MYDLWWPFSPNLIDSNNGYGKFLQFSNFLAGLPLNNGHYVDAAATTSVATTRVVGQRDLTNNVAHFWVRDVSMKWANAPGVPGAGAIGQPSGTVTIPGLANGSYALDIWWFDIQGMLNRDSQTLTSSGSALVMDAGALSAMHPTLTDFAVQLTVGVLSSGFVPRRLIAPR